MKKIKIALALVIVAALVLTGCNKQIIDFQYTFDAAIITINGETKVYSITSWTDYADGEQLQLILKDGSVLLVSSYNTILVCTNDNGNSMLINDLSK